MEKKETPEAAAAAVTVVPVQVKPAGEVLM